ncbi:MAG: branched-chain amino acid ABC transporter permease [Lachnospiraceae bacterium]|nr:branched-chain amino acid ABC transporter permease [Lachnospiraceae bacterium]
MNRKKKLSGKSLILFRAAVIVVLYALIACVVEFKLLNRMMLSLVIPVGINIILAVSLNITVGFLGELSLGHAGFMALGAYTSALITLNVTGLPKLLTFILSMLLGGIVAAFFGILIGMPVLRLRGDYLAIVTLGFGEIIRGVINVLPITGQAMGISRIPKYSTYTIVFIVAVITILISMNLLKSRHGRAICAIRDNYIAAEAMGVPITRYKIMAFSIAAFFAGIAGALYAHNVTFIKPTDFDYNKSIDILVYVVLGGMGSIKGSVIAAVVLTLLPNFLRSADDLRMVLYALALIVIMIVNAGGYKDRFLEKYREKKIRRKAEKEAQ